MFLVHPAEVPTDLSDYRVTRPAMDLTSGNDAAFTEGTVQEILAVAQASMRGEIGRKLEDEERRRAKAEERIRELEETDWLRVQRRQAFARTWARGFSIAALVIAIALLLAGALFAFPWGMPGIKDAWFRYAAAALQVVIAVLGVANLTFGTSVQDLTRRLESRLFRWIDGCLTRRTEYATPADNGPG